MAIDDKDSVGEKVRSYREGRGWSQKELAEKAELSPSTISKVEGDVFTPTPDTVQRIADALGVKLGELIDVGVSAELETVVQIDLMKIFVERKEYHDALQNIAELEKRGDLLEHQKRDVIMYKAESLMRTERTEEAIGLLSVLRANLEKAQAVDEHIVAEVFNRLGNAYFLASNLADAHAHYVRAHQVALTFAMFDELAAKITYNLGIACSWLKNPSEATEYLEKAERFFREIADEIELADILFAQGQCYRDLNQLEVAERYFVEALSLFKSQNLLELAQMVKYSLASSVTAATEIDLGIEQLQECVENFKELGKMPRVAFTYVRIAELLMKNDRFTEADHYLLEAQQILQSVKFAKYDHNHVYSFYYKVFAKSQYQKQKYREAVGASFNSSELFGKMGIKRDEADSLEVAVDAYLRLGESDEAIKLARRISDILRESLNSFAKMEVLQ